VAFDFQSMKRSFFDTAEVMERVDKMRRKALARQGAFVRRRAKSSLKYRAGRSDPGSPPNVHRGPRFTRQKKDRKTGATKQLPASPLRELVYFAFDADADSVVVGPEVFRNALAPGVAPKALEHGGPSVVRTRRGPRSMMVRARPFMRPAEEAERPKFAMQFKGQL